MESVNVEDIKAQLAANKEKALELLPEKKQAPTVDSELVDRMRPYLNDESQHGMARLILAAMGEDPEVILPRKPATIDISDLIIEGAAYHIVAMDGEETALLVLTPGNKEEPTIASVEGGFVQMGNEVLSIEVVTDDEILNTIAENYTDAYTRMLTDVSDQKNKVSLSK